MRLQQSHCSIGNVVPYTDSVRSFLKHNRNEDSEVKEFSNSTLGGILTDINYTWLCNGPKLEVLSTKTGVKVAAWTFGEVIKDYYTRITCVVDLPTINSRTPVLVVGLQSGGTRGMICIFDIRTSRVLRAIQISKPVTSIHVIDVGCESSLPGALRALDGIVAVGTEEGRIYLVDMCRQACEDAVNSCNKDQIRDEITACDLIQISINDIPMLEKHKETTLKTGDHLCLQLNEFCTDKEFILRGPSGEIRLRANIVEVKISALHYCPQLGSLLVGFNFGAFQLYNLLTVKLEYASPAYEDCIPVSHFAFQEPCDDPRAFCYIWVMYSNIESDLPGFPLSVMYSLSYGTKEYLEGYGYLYQDLSTCSIRFQTELKSLPLMSNLQKPIGASCISLNAYTKGVQKYNGGIISQEIVEDRLALCSVVWSVFDAHNVEIFMCLFDLNQWYKEQMPAAPTEDSGSYMIFAALSDLILTATQSKRPLLDVKIDSKSITQFTSAQRLEEHYFPNALSFKVICIREDDIIWIDSTGIQRHLLSLLKTAGPLSLLRPTEIFQQCIMHGLSPLNSDVIYSTLTALNLQREMILSVALEHQLISWLCQCAQEWCNGSQSIGGCTLDFLLNWAWNRTTTLKTIVNESCSPLFDYSGLRLDSNALITLNDCARQLKHLSTLYEYILSRCSQFLFEARHDEIVLQYSALKMISVYIEVLQWLLNVGLLPECPIYMYPRPDESERISAPYPVDSLMRFYKNRRQELFELQGIENARDYQSCDLLFIDNLIDIECGGELLHNDWKNDGGSGLYPPPSLQALLRTYLVEDVDIVYKHCIFIYVFLDLAMTLDQSRYTPIITHLIKFPAVFKLSPSVIKITQAFWQLDHGDFSTAMAQLLDPLVSNEVLQPWHHRIAVKALLAQGQHQHALLYHQVRKPPMTNVQDLLIAITVLIVNDLLKEAFHFQRQNRSECTEKEILHHFMEACDKTNKLFQVIQLPLNDVEEMALIRYLQDNRREETDKYLIQYYLQRSRFAEAFENNDKINGKLFEKQGLVGQTELNSRNSLVQRYKSTLPAVTQDLLSHCSLQTQNIEHNICHVLERPDPMSVYVHKSQDKLKYKSSLIQASLQKAKETWANVNKNTIELPFIATPKKIIQQLHNLTPVIIPKLIHNVSVKDVDEENEGPTPNKRQRLSPRQPIGSDKDKKHKRRRLPTAKILLLNLTPIVKRRTIRNRSVSAASILDYPGSPQSILKVRKLVKKSGSPVDRGNSTTPEILEISSADETEPFEDLTKDTIKNSIIDLSDYNIQTPKNKSVVMPRKSLRMSKTPTVHFVDSRASTPSSEGSIENMVIDVQIETPKVNSTREKIIPAVLEEDNTIISPNTRKRKLNDSVQSRRSYKDTVLLNDTAKLLESIDNALETPRVEKRSEISDREKPKAQFPKVSGRKSLTRKVLEQNTIVKALSSPRKTKSSNKSNNTVGVEISRTETIKSYVKEVGVNKIKESTNTNILETKNKYSTETDPDTASKIIKHTHNESYKKSSTKLTEFLEDSVSDVSSIDPILAQGSDVDESFLREYVQNKSSAYNTLSDSMAKNLEDFDDSQDDIINILPGEDEEIIEIQSIENKDKTETTEEYVSLDSDNEENAEDIPMESMEKSVVVNVEAVENQPFEITDDLTDEDVSFTIHSTMNVQIDTSKTSNGNIMEMKDMEPENYIEPNFEEEVRNVLAEDSEIDEQYLNIEYVNKTEDYEYKESEDSSSNSSSENQQDNIVLNIVHEKNVMNAEDPEKISNQDENEEEQIISDDEKEDKQTISSDSLQESESSNESETSLEEKISNQENEENIEQVIEVCDSSEEEIMLQINEELEEDEHFSSSSVDLFEKNITSSNITLEPFESINNSEVTEEVQIEEKYDEIIAINEPDSEIKRVEISEITPVNQYDKKIDEPSCSKEIQIEERPRRTTRASSVAPISTNEITRKTRGRSVDVEMISTTQRSINEKVPLTPGRRGRKPSIQKDEQAKETMNALLENTNEDISLNEVEVVKAKSPSRRVCKPSVDTENIKSAEPREINIIETRENIKNLASENVTVPLSVLESDQEQKMDTCENVKDLVTESILLAGDQESIIQIENVERSEINQELIPVSSENIPVRRGRKPSNEEVVEEDQDVNEQKIESSQNIREDSVKISECNQGVDKKKVELTQKFDEVISENVLSIPKETAEIESIQNVEKTSRSQQPSTKISESNEGMEEQVIVSTQNVEEKTLSAEISKAHQDMNKRIESIQNVEEKIPVRRSRKASIQKEPAEISVVDQNVESTQNVEEKIPVRRGRKPNVDTNELKEDVDGQKLVPSENVEEKKPVRRGRKASVHKESVEISGSKDSVDEQKIELTQNIEEKIPAKRGRKPSVDTSQLKQDDDDNKSVTSEKVPVRRGRKPSQTDTDTPVRQTRQTTSISTETSKEEKLTESIPLTPSRRGRKPSQTDIDTPMRQTRQSTKILDETSQEEQLTESVLSTPSRRGRKPSQTDIDTPVRQTKQSTDISDDISKVDKLTDPALFTPSRRGRKASVSKEENTEITTPARRSKRTSLQGIEPILEETEAVGTPSRRIGSRRTSIQSEQEESKPSTPSRRIRRLSTQSEDVNLMLTPTRRGRKSSVKSEDIKLTPSRRTTRASSILSEEKSPTKSGSESASSKPSGLQSYHDQIEEYAATHRLTRRQKVMIEKMMKEKGLPLSEIDPLALLDKESFSGEPDLEEQHHMHSPASSIGTESSIGTRSSSRIHNRLMTPDKSHSNSPSLPSTPINTRMTRSTLKLLESPVPEEDQHIDENEPSTSSGTRVKRKSFTAAEQLMSSPIVRKQRRISQDSVTSGNSIQSEVVVKMNRLDDTEMDRLRHRSLSPSVLKQDSQIDSPVPGKNKKKGRTSILVKPELSKISEESTSLETGLKSKEEPKTSSRRGRSKKL